MRTRRSLQRIMTICGLFIAFALCGCSGDEPPKELVQNFLERWVQERTPKSAASLTKIVAVEPKWVKNGDSAYEGKVEVTFASQQDTYEASTLKEALEKAGEQSAELTLYRHAI
ncbi:hypothetical protein LJC23_07795, partial [Desulfovibrio sp. OttesenSCG-928-I05]|nr:hypothetical protein [Desulfovibrio sp. OttesenSCG-928-I05]